MGLWIIALLIGAVALFAYLSYRKKAEPVGEERVPTYVCRECGERHCNCYLEESPKD